MRKARFKMACALLRVAFRIDPEISVMRNWRIDADGTNSALGRNAVQYDCVIGYPPSAQFVRNPGTIGPTYIAAGETWNAG